MISKNTIDAVFETARIEEVIGDFVQLKRSGSNLKGLSPFVNEKTPSFMVSPSKQIWKDFSSGKGGNVVTFLMEHGHFSYPEAIRYLAQKYQIEIEETQPNPEEKEQASERESMYLVSEFAQKYFYKALMDSEEGRAVGLSYFKERGFTNDTLQKFGLGYSPDQRSAFTDEALKKGYQIEFLEKTGLTIVKDDKRYDRFKGRVMFPIHSLSGRVVGFGGRILINDKKAAKYLNSPESEIYHKSKVLYGIYQAKQIIAKQDNCYLVEGYTDVLQFYQSGIENVVASSGTALTTEQIRLISRMTKNITVLFDGDAAGLRASLRGIDLILGEGLNVKVCLFPDGEDPDSFARKNSLEQLTSYLEEQSKDFIQFKAALLLQESQNDPIKKAECIRDMVNSISKIPDRIKREIYIKETAQIMEISEEVLVNTLAQILKKEHLEVARQNTENETLRKEETPIESTNFLEVIEENILKVLLNHASKELTFEDIYDIPQDNGEIERKSIRKTQKVYERIYLSLQADEIEFSNDNFRKIYQHLIEFITQNNTFDRERYLASVPQELLADVSNLLLADERYHLDRWETKNIFPRDKDDEGIIVQNITETVLNLRCYLIYKLIGSLMQQTKDQRSGSDNAEILSEVLRYSQLRKFLFSLLGNVTPLNHYIQYQK